MDRWTVDAQPPPVPARKRGTGQVYGLGAVIIGAVIGGFFLLSNVVEDRPAMRLSEELQAALSATVANNSPALDTTARAQLLADKQAAALLLRATLNPMTAQETALFDLLNGQLADGQLALRLETVDDMLVGAAYAQLRMDYDLAARLLSRAIELAPDRAEVALNLADLLAEQGRVTGDQTALLHATQTYRAWTEIYPNNNAYHLAVNNLGASLHLLGRATQNAGILEEAAYVLADALRLLPENTAPAQVAVAQANLAAALIDLAGPDNDQALLIGAENALRAAIAATPGESAATYQFQLASVLLRLDHPAGQVDWLNETGRLVAAAVSTDTPGGVQLQLDYANALSIAGEQSADRSLLTRAVLAYNAALAACDSTATPMTCAAGQSNLGTILATRVAMDGDATNYQAATSAFKAALLIYQGQGANIDWALTQNNLALTMEGQAARLGDTNILNEAMRRYAAALDRLQGLDDGLAQQVRFNLSQAETQTVVLQMRMAGN